MIIIYFQSLNFVLGTYLSLEKGFDCLKCSKDCSLCVDHLNCMKCMSPLVLENGFCQKACSIFKYFDENSLSCQNRMVSWSFLISAFGLFLGMELVRKFWKQIRNSIKKGIKDLCNRRKRTLVTEESMQNIQKITELEKKNKSLSN
jgi:hypothetical protein